MAAPATNTSAFTTGMSPLTTDMAKTDVRSAISTCQSLPVCPGSCSVQAEMMPARETLPLSVCPGFLILRHRLPV